MLWLFQILQDCAVHPICSAILLLDLVRPSFWARQGHLVSDVLLPLPDPSNGKSLRLWTSRPLCTFFSTLCLCLKNLDKVHPCFWVLVCTLLLATMLWCSLVFCVCLLVRSVSMCRTLPSPCSSARSRKNGTQPLLTVSDRGVLIWIREETLWYGLYSQGQESRWSYGGHSMIY